MTIQDLQNELAKRGFYTGRIDGKYGDGTRSALLACLKAGPDTPLTNNDIVSSANALGVSPAHIQTIVAVEAAGAGFFNGLPKILFEGHIFSRLTNGRFNASHPRLSYPRWDKSKYPKTQEGRYAQLLDAVALDPDAAFSAASYGAFQILGSNYKVCGYGSAFDFVLAQCETEGEQLKAFVGFVKGNKLDDELRTNNWAGFARGYNGPAYRENAYDVKLANAYQRYVNKPLPVSASPQLLVGPVRAGQLMNVRRSPGGDVIGTVPRAGLMTIIRHIGEWAEVRLASGAIGYANSRYLVKA
jgi:hypothetical protein